MNGDANYLAAAEHIVDVCFEYELEMQKFRDEIARLNLEVAELQLENRRLRNSIEVPSTPLHMASPATAATPKLKKRRRKH